MPDAPVSSLDNELPGTASSEVTVVGALPSVIVRGGVKEAAEGAGTSPLLGDVEYSV